MYSCRHLVLAFSVGVMTVSTALIAILCRARLPPGVGYTRLMLILVGLLIVAAPLVAGDDDGPPPRKAPRLVGNDDDPRPDPHPEVQDSPLSPDPDDSVEEYDSDATVENLIPGSPDPWAFGPRPRQRPLNDTAVEDLLLGPWEVLEAAITGMPLPPSPSPPRAAARRLPLQTMPLPRPRRLPRISIAPAQAPSTSRSSGGSNVATVAPAPSTSRSSAGPNVDSTQPSTSTGRTGACRRPPTAASGVDVARQRLRELVLDHFLQVFVSPAHAPVACTVGALVAMSTLRAELRDMLWLVDHLLDETPRDQSLVIAYALWREVRSSLEGLLIGIGESMESAASRDPYDIDPEEPEPSPPARHVRCCVCMDRLPTVGLRPCGHTLCPQCAHRLLRCPICRVIIHGRMPLFFS
ncbi:uncharacterized protein LOC124365235 [Homalodisca vitripennis]|uniref:uncharacterized protein LOC124365235 n=2 Tax=Homalodisca vitripennis TaxID=197043 RepID=UPI001EECD1E0|nr:uncharacterized protein LOC124365235 [Homalodisca vitripennis]